MGVFKLNAAAWGNAKYVIAHPESAVGDPNYADERDYDLVAVCPNGLMIYRRKSMIVRWSPRMIAFWTPSLLVYLLYTIWSRF